MSAVDSTEDLIDSRDVIARIDQLSALRVAGPVPEGILEEDDYDTDQDTLFHELAALEALANEASSYAPDWEYGATLIRDSYFKEYAQDLAEDIGAVDPEIGWPYSCIDWNAAANALKQDYMAVEFDGVTYWIQ